MSSSHDFKTPLHIAAASGHFEAVRTLIKFGASLRKLDSKGHSAVDASKSRQISSVSLSSMFGSTRFFIKTKSQNDSTKFEFFRIDRSNL